MSARQKRVRWTIEEAAAEFDIAPKTLAKRLKTQGVDCGDDGKWSTLQMHRAVAGDIQGERLRETKERADKLALENSQLRGTLLNVDLLRPAFSDWATAITQKVKASHLSQAEKGALLKELRDFDFHEAIARAAGGGGVSAEPGQPDGPASAAERKPVGRKAPKPLKRGKRNPGPVD